MDISKVEDRRRALSPGIRRPEQRERLREVAQGYLKLRGVFLTNTAGEESAGIVRGCDRRARARAGLGSGIRVSAHVGGLAWFLQPGSTQDRRQEPENLK